MEVMRLDYPLEILCRALEVSKSGYFAWLNRPLSKHAQDEARLEIEIRAAHERTRQSYGPERLQEELEGRGIEVGVHRIKRIRKKLGICCKQVRRFKATTNSKHTLPVAENLLNQNFTVDGPGVAWVGDITYIRTEEGWLYLAGLKDLFTGEIVGYAMSERMTKGLVIKAFNQAVEVHRPLPGLIHHTDRGSQYCADDYQKLVKKHKMKASMSGKGNCYDNAPMESFWGILKTELVYQLRFETREHARRTISEYIEIFYNRQRRQARLGYLSPAAFKQQYWKQAA
jgi:putative transposase